MSITTIKPAIEVNNVSVSYETSVILDHITCTIQPGEYVALIGPNGAGKTTLLKIILGLLKPAEGNVKLFGQSIDTFQHKYQLGYIPQRISASLLKFPATVAEVVRSGRTARLGIFKPFAPKDEEAIQWAVKIAGIEKYKDQSISQLSGGELQRVFIARALAGEPKILLLDEPTVGVDLSAQEKFYAFLQDLNKNLGLTIVIVTHEVDVAVHRAKFVLCLNRKLICHIRSSLLLKGDYLEQLYGSHVHVLRHKHYEEHA